MMMRGLGLWSLRVFGDTSGCFRGLGLGFRVQDYIGTYGSSSTSSRRTPLGRPYNVCFVGNGRMGFIDWGLRA